MSNFEDYAIDPLTNDVEISQDGHVQQTTGKVRIVQQIASRLESQRGEFFLDESSGPDWIGVVLVKNANIGRVRAEIAQQVEAVPGVNAVEQVGVVIDSSTRAAQITFIARTDLGTIEGSTSS